MTKHLKQRMSQRGITGEMIELAQQFGIIDGDRVALTRDHLHALLKHLRAAERTALKLLDKGGLVVIEEGDNVVTTYNYNSYDRRRRSDKARAGRRPRGYEARGDH